MGKPTSRGRRWYWSETLLLASLNAAAYWWNYRASGWSIPHSGTYLCLLGAVLSVVPLPRELFGRTRLGALIGLALSAGVLWHVNVMPCTGPCK